MVRPMRHIRLEVRLAVRIGNGNEILLGINMDRGQTESIARLEAIRL